MMSFCEQPNQAKLMSLRGKLAALACHPIKKKTKLRNKPVPL
jgi:hypothetical protein